MTELEKNELILAGLILPKRAETEAERAALQSAALIQTEFEQRLPAGVKRISESNDGVTVDITGAGAAFGICAAAKAVLRAAGLISPGLPVAKPL